MEFDKLEQSVVDFKGGRLGPRRVEQLTSELADLADGTYFGQCTEQTPWEYMYPETVNGVVQIRCRHTPPHIYSMR